MFSMQKIAVLALACTLGMVALPQNVSAQDSTSGSATGGGRGGRMGGGRGGAMFQAALDLTDLTAEQKDKINALKKTNDDAMKEAREKMQSGGQPSDEERTAMREKMMSAQKDNKEKIEAILTADQKTKFEEALAKQPQGGRWGGSRGTSGTAEAKPEPKMDAAPKAETK